MIARGRFPSFSSYFSRDLSCRALARYLPAGTLFKALFSLGFPSFLMIFALPRRFRCSLEGTASAVALPYINVLFARLFLQRLASARSPSAPILLRFPCAFLAFFLFVANDFGLRRVRPGLVSRGSFSTLAPLPLPRTSTSRQYSEPLVIFPPLVYGIKSRQGAIQLLCLFSAVFLFFSYCTLTGADRIFFDQFPLFFPEVHAS